MQARRLRHPLADYTMTHVVRAEVAQSGCACIVSACWRQRAETSSEMRGQSSRAGHAAQKQTRSGASPVKKGIGG